VTLWYLHYLLFIAYGSYNYFLLKPDETKHIKEYYVKVKRHLCDKLVTKVIKLLEL